MSSPLELKSARFLHFHDETRKELKHVYNTYQEDTRVPIHRLVQNIDSRGASASASRTEAPPYFAETFLNSHSILSSHRALVLHSLSLNFGYFSLFQINDFYLKPLWAQLTTQGRGLRASGPEYAEQAENLFSQLKLPSPKLVVRSFVNDPAVAFRIGYASVAQELLNGTLKPAALPWKRSKAYLEALLTPLNSAHASNLTEEEFLSLAALGVAKAARTQNLERTSDHTTLEKWIEVNVSEPSSLRREISLLAAQTINSINLYYLKSGQPEKIEALMKQLDKKVLPALADTETRNHVTGNFLYQRSIMARMAGDVNTEMDFLSQAAGLDSHFATLHYRTAQILHDQGDQRAKEHYELAIALGPFDFPTVNDYGCFLSESEDQEGLESLTEICSVIFGSKSENEVATVELGQT